MDEMSNIKQFSVSMVVQICAGFVGFFVISLALVLVAPRSAQFISAVVEKTVDGDSLYWKIKLLIALLGMGNVTSRVMDLAFHRIQWRKVATGTVLAWTERRILRKIFHNRRIDIRECSRLRLLARRIWEEKVGMPEQDFSLDERVVMSTIVTDDSRKSGELIVLGAALIWSRCIVAFLVLSIAIVVIGSAFESFGLPHAIFLVTAILISIIQLVTIKNLEEDVQFLEHRNLAQFIFDNADFLPRNLRFAGGDEKDLKPITSPQEKASSVG